MTGYLIRHIEKDVCVFRNYLTNRKFLYFCSTRLTDGAIVNFESRKSMKFFQ